MQTRLHSSHETTVSIHGIARIEVAADALLRDDGEPAYWQELRFYDAEDVSLGLVTLFLARPGVALPVGSLPPYWGLDITKPVELGMDGEAPF